MSQYESNYYGNGGGGGYIQGGSPFSASASSPGGMRRTEILNSLRAFTIAQLNKATQAHTDAEWRVDELEIGQTTLVAQVVSIQKQTTNCVYVVDDGTGSIEARRWIDSSQDGDPNKADEIREQTYVRITGTLKSFGKKRYVNATHIHNIQDPHEIYFHILEAITANLILERGPPSTSGNAFQKKTEIGGTGGNISAYSAQSTGRGGDQYSHLPELQRSIIRFILDQPPRDEGVHVAQIAKAIGANADDARKIGNALDILMDEGHVFTTIDDSHFNVSL